MRPIRLFAGCGVVALSVLACASCQQAGPGDLPANQHPPVAAAACPAGLIPAAGTAFGEALIKEVAASAFYLSEALEHGQTGQTVLCVQLGRAGDLLKALVSESSRFALLDGSALYAVGKAFAENPATRIPNDIAPGESSVWFAVPIEFLDTTPGESSEPLAVPPCHDAKEPYFEALKKILSKHIFYPPKAIMRKLEGEAEFRFAVGENGRISKVEIFKTADDPLFDGAGLLTLGFIDLSADRPCTRASDLVTAAHETFEKLTIRWELIGAR